MMALCDGWIRLKLRNHALFLLYGSILDPCFASRGVARPVKPMACLVRPCIPRCTSCWLLVELERPDLLMESEALSSGSCDVDTPVGKARGRSVSIDVDVSKSYVPCCVPHGFLVERRVTSPESRWSIVGFPGAEGSGCANVSAFHWRFEVPVIVFGQPEL